MDYPSTEVFTRFAQEVEPRLRFALAAELGSERGREATQDALVWAWEHWERLDSVHNRAGYLYRVAKRRAMRSCQGSPSGMQTASEDPPASEPGLQAALAHLTARQRTAVFLVEGLGMTYQQAADYLGVSRSTIQSHLERGLDGLRRQLGVSGAA